jgi:hypothetical protein
MYIIVMCVIQQHGGDRTYTAYVRLPLCSCQQQARASCIICTLFTRRLLVVGSAALLRYLLAAALVF